MLTVALAITLITAAAAQAHRNPRVTVAQTLNQGLAHTPMRGTGYQLERAGYQHHISPYFIAAIAATESSLGRAACANNPYNAFGLASCGHSWHVPQFRSWAQAYMFMGRFLSQRWPHARTPYDYHGYAACTPCWARKTAWWMTIRFHTTPKTRYP